MIFKGSRYAKGVNVYYDPDNKMSYVGFPDTFISEDKTDIIYTIQSGETLEGLAVKYYGSTKFKWILMYANPQYTTELDVKAGDEIRIPSMERMIDYVNGT